MLQLGVLASGRGSNLQALLDASRSGRLPAEVVVVISNNSGAAALERARQAGIPAVHLSARTHPEAGERDQALLTCLQAHRVEAVVLAGYMKPVGPLVVGAYRSRILNVHPALLPLFGGQGMYGAQVHEAVWRSGMKITGATVHLVEDIYDNGPILLQAPVGLTGCETPAEIAALVLAREHELLVEAVLALAEDRVRREAGRAWVVPATKSTIAPGFRHFGA